MSAMRFGMLSFGIAPYAELARRCCEAEALGFDSFWLADELNIPDYGDFEIWTLLAALARETTHIRLGSLVASVSFRHPAFLAAQAITVDHISQGRVDVGVGAGGPPNNYASLGLEPWGAAERNERLKEQVIILDSLLRGAPTFYEGKYYRTANDAVPQPVQNPRPRLVIAAHGERGLRLAAQYADGWNSLGGQPYPDARLGKSVTLGEAVEITRQRNRQLDSYCAELGRDPATVTRSIAVYRPVPPDPLSSPQAFDDYVGRYAEAGIDEIIFYWPSIAVVLKQNVLSTAQQAMFERIATERFSAWQGRVDSQQ